MTEVLLNKSALQITYMQFSDHKKQMLVGKYPTEYKELVNAFLHDSQERVNNLCHRFEGEEMKIGDLRNLVGLAQDFVAAYRLLEGKLTLSPLRNTVDKEDEEVHTPTPHHLTLLTLPNNQHPSP